MFVEIALYICGVSFSKFLFQGYTSKHKDALIYFYGGGGVGNIRVYACRDHVMDKPGQVAASISETDQQTTGVIAAS